MHGRDQASELQRRLRAEMPSGHVLSVDRLQCLETARYLVTDRRRDIEVLTLSPYRLGLIEGLSWEEISGRYPEIVDRFEAWNRGEIDITELDLPAAQNPHEYYLVGWDFLQELATRADTAIIVATRSVLVLLWNALQGNDPSSTTLYRHVNWDNAELRVVDWPTP